MSGTDSHPWRTEPRPAAAPDAVAEALAVVADYLIGSGQLAELEHLRGLVVDSLDADGGRVSLGRIIADRHRTGRPPPQPESRRVAVLTAAGERVVVDVVADPHGLSVTAVAGVDHLAVT